MGEPQISVSYRAVAFGPQNGIYAGVACVEVVPPKWNTLFRLDELVIPFTWNGNVTLELARARELDPSNNGPMYGSVTAGNSRSSSKRTLLRTLDMMLPERLQDALEGSADASGKKIWEEISQNKLFHAVYAFGYTARAGRIFGKKKFAIRQSQIMT